MDLNNELRADLQQVRGAASSEASVREENTNANSQNKSVVVDSHAIVGAESSLDESQSEVVPYFGAPPLNSARATPSQLRALERIKKKNRSLMVLAQRPARRVMNYAKANSD